MHWIISEGQHQGAQPLSLVARRVLNSAGSVQTLLTVSCFMTVGSQEILAEQMLLPEHVDLPWPGALMFN